ncbi:hypothetical protein H4582DRAFT_1883901 [Lactarius indigo]|nr:hypothetical protein H4582DRAFT_1883901 [Lactarius indigo]
MGTKRRTTLLQKQAQRSRRNRSHAQQRHTNQDQNAPNFPPSLYRPCVATLRAVPAELLAHISTFCTEMPDGKFLPYPAWLPITRVCRHWRTVALSHSLLWTSVTPGLSLRWIEVFIERSRTLLMDFDIRVAPTWPDTGTSYRDIIRLLTGFTRIRSLCLTGPSSHTVLPVINSLRRSLPIQSLSLCIHEYCTLPNDLFGGNAPIRRLQLTGGYIPAPHWLLRGVTHFTSSESTSPSDLLDILRQMPALAYFESRTGYPHWIIGDMNQDMDTLRASPVQMPQLMDLVVSATPPDQFIVLNQLLLLQVGARRRLELPSSAFHSKFFDMYSIDDLLPVVEATNRLHIHFSGTQMEGWFRLWTGNAATTWEDAEFCLYTEWRAARLSRENLRDLFALCDALGAARVRNLVIDSLTPALPKSYWWKLLENLPEIEELELSPTSVDVLGSAWKVNKAPVVLPALQRVRIMGPKLDNSSPQYAITGDTLARSIVRLPSSTEGDVAPSPKVVSAEEELENMSKGLVKLLRGSAGRVG